MAPPGDVSTATLVEVCARVRDVLGAEEAYVMRAGDPHFVRVDEPGDPTAYEVKQKGYFIAWRELAVNPDLVGGLGTVVDRHLEGAVPLAAGVPATHLAVLLPGDESRSELLIVRGPWPAGLTPGQVTFFTVARPILAMLVSTLLDTQRRHRQRDQLQSLASIAAALTRGQELEAALPALCTALAKASGIEWVTLTLVNETLDRVTARVGNSARHSESTTTAMSLEGAMHREWALATALHLVTTRRPSLYGNVADPASARRIAPEFQRYLARAHVLASGTFPLWSGDRLLGTLNFSDSVPHGFDPAEVEFLTLLCEQAVLAIEWLTLQRELRDANAALARAATHDALTGLPNRLLFLDRLTQILGHARRTGSTVAVLFLDLDDFKAVNDRFGHETGDRLLQVVAERLQRNLRAGDTAARFGGDEFTVVLSDVTDRARACRAAARLQAAIEQPVELAGQLLAPRVSVGVASGTAEGVSAEELLRRADAAMYRCKARRKSRLQRGGSAGGQLSLA